MLLPLLDMVDSLGTGGFKADGLQSWPPELKDEQLSMTFLKLYPNVVSASGREVEEFYPIVVAAVLWGEKWKSSTLL